ncbi:MAG: hypothetical protein ACRDJU_12285 [Actinomycetota bacterium]
MTYPYADPAEVEAVLGQAAVLGLIAPTPLAGGMASQADSLVASCAAEIAQLERAHCRLLAYRVVATGDVRDVFVVALSAVARRSRQLQRLLEQFGSIPGASWAVRA